MYKESRLKVELEALQQNLHKLREENSKEEEELKRKKQNSEQFLAENMGLYDHLMEENTKEKADLLVILILIFKNLIRKMGFLQDEHHKINKELRDLDEHFTNVNSERARELELERQLKERLNVNFYFVWMGFKNLWFIQKYDVEQKRRSEACRHIVIALKNMIGNFFSLSLGVNFNESYLEKKSKKKKKKPKKKKK